MPAITPDILPIVRERADVPGVALPQPAPQPTTRTIPGPANAPDVRVVVVDPGGEGARPALLYVHGGGFIFGNVSGDIAMLQRLAQTLNILIVSVDYRLAPETPFPGGLEDTYAALLWLYRNAQTLMIDRSRIAIGGVSAGGGLAAMLTIAARDRREVPVAFQLLLAPMLDDRTGSQRTVPPYIGRYSWSAQANRFGWTSWLGVPAGSRDVPAGSVPARTENLAGLPPTFIGVGSIDLFAEEDVTYACRLLMAGVRTELLVVPGAYHAFDKLVPDAEVSRRYTAAWTDALRRGLRPIAS
jgi:acetyl esterase/lipase